MRSTSLYLILVLILLTALPACQPAAVQVCPTCPPPPTSLPPTTEPSPPPQPTAVPTLPLLGCSAQEGELEPFKVKDAAVGKEVEGAVLLPPCGAQPGLPVLLLMHGQATGIEVWQRLGLPALAGRLMASGEIPPFLIVLPREEYYLSDISTSPYGEAVIKTVLPWVRQKYAPCTRPECLALGGISRGAQWAASLGVAYWDKVGSVGAHSLPSAPYLEYYLRDLLARKNPPVKMPRFYLDSGDQDTNLQKAVEFENMLARLRIPHQWRISPGLHDEAYWSAHLEEYLRWYA